MFASATICIAGTAAMLFLLALGVPVGLAMAVVGFAGFTLFGGLDMALGQLQNLPYYLTSDYKFAVVPLFVVMGTLAMNGGMARDLYDAADKWLRGVRGGMYLTTIAASAAFGAASGSTVVNATVFTRVALPEMLRLGHSKSFSAACITAVGTLDAMIPPSVVMVIYAVITEQSLGRLMIAGIVPGILSAILYGVFVAVYVRLKPGLAPPPTSRAPWGERLRGLKSVWVVTVLFVTVMGGIYLGAFPPSAAGAIGAFGTLLVLLLQRRLTRAGFWEAFCSSASVTAVLFTIIIGGVFFSRMLVATGFISDFLSAMKALSLPPLAVILFVAVLYGILGCLIDTASMLIVTLPFVYPLAQAADIDPIWFGIIVVQLVELGAITPPVGLNLFATVSAADGLITMDDILRGIIPFIILTVGILALLIAFPSLSLWLPSTMMGK